MANLTMQGERLRWLSILTPERYSSAVYEHNEIMNQIKSNNKVKARECISNHLNLTKSTYEKATKNSSLDEIIMAFKQLNQEVKISSNTVK